MRRDGICSQASSWERLKDGVPSSSLYGGGLLELQEGLRDGVKAPAMERGGAEAGEGCDVLGTAVAFVAGEAVAGKLAVEFDEKAVAVDLGED